MASRFKAGFGGVSETFLSAQVTIQTRVDAVGKNPSGGHAGEFLIAVDIERAPGDADGALLALGIIH